ncbi:MAG: glycoside hydrolase family 43 protein [Verrucomicrobia bacterium]|nr:glycoside hydrolase family 43 protein [Verrucomicrobiota bacterium]
MAIALDELRNGTLDIQSSKPVSFTNPVIKGFNPDPSICRVGDDFYLAVSSFEYFPGVPLYHSRDLVHWRPIGHALTRTSQLNLTGRPGSLGVFAPTLRYHKGLFYLVTTDVGGCGNFLVTATDPAGPWSEPTLIDTGCFDPSLLFDDDGRVYYTRRFHSKIAQAELDLATGKLLTPLRLIADAFSSSDAEGPHLYKINGWYYLLCAEGGTGYGHMITIGRSQSPWGPFESCPGNPILTHRHKVPHAIRYTGHGDLIELQDGSWWIVFLGTRHDPRYGYNFHVMGRETFLAPVDWIDGWPVINSGRPIELSMTGPALPSAPWDTADDDTVFCQDGLAPQWSTLRAPLSQSECERLPDGGLRLRGNATHLDGAHCPVYVCRRQTDPDFTFSATVRFNPANYGEEAGIALRQSDDCFLTLSICRESTGVFLRVRRRVLDMYQTMARIPFNGDVCHFQVSGNWTHYTFSAGQSEQALTVLDRCPIRFLSTELSTGWTGVTMGPFASGNGQVSRSTADFTRISYQAHS